MRIMIYSDVHGNLPAFEAALKHAGPCDSYISLGDLVNYGPWSNECVDLALSLPNPVLLMGNHEEYYLAGRYPVETSLVQLFLNQTIRQFNRLSEIGQFADSYNLGPFTCIHTINQKKIYADSTVTLDHSYCIGHTHHQFVLQNNGFTLYNAGSVGQSRDKICYIRYLIVEDETFDVELRQTSFDPNLIISKMRELSYPVACLDYYISKS